MSLRKETIKTYISLILGASILSFGLFNIHSQSGITEGGILGTTLLLKHWFHISPGISEPVLDIICYLIGFKLLGKKFLKYAVTATGSFALFYNIYEGFGYVIPDLTGYPLLASILGGLFVGVGVGLIVRAGGASGGDDALALIIQKITGCKISKAYLFTDIVVLILSLSYIPFRKIIFSFITITISSFLIEKIQSFKTHKDEADQLTGQGENPSKDTAALL